MKVADLNVMDQNDMDEDSDHGYRNPRRSRLVAGAPIMFEIRETDTDNDPDDGDDDNDGSTWEVWLKDDATFNFEGLKTARRRPDHQ